jgi:hypothetical protein
MKISGETRNTRRSDAYVGRKSDLVQPKIERNVKMEDQKQIVVVEEIEEFVFEQLEDRIVPISGGCVTSSSCNCSSSSCIITSA